MRVSNLVVSPASMFTCLRAINWSLKRHGVECRGEFLERNNTFPILLKLRPLFSNRNAVRFSISLSPPLGKSPSKNVSLQPDCDSTIQIPSQPVSLADCFMPCSGNNNETCGGPNRLNVFSYSAFPPPVIVQSVNGTQSGLWTYRGCYTSVLFYYYYLHIVRLSSFTTSCFYSDSISNRTLNNDVNIPAGTTAESCAAACQAAGGFTYAGLENGHECCE